MWHFQLCCCDWMIHVMWRASVRAQRLKPTWLSAGNKHTSMSIFPSLCRRENKLVSLPPSSWQTWKGLAVPDTMVTDTPCTRWVLRWGFSAESPSLGLISSLSSMEYSQFSYALISSRPSFIQWHDLICQNSPFVSRCQPTITATARPLTHGQTLHSVNFC